VICAVVIDVVVLTGGRGVLRSFSGRIYVGACSSSGPATQRIVAGVVVEGAVIAERARTLIAAQHRRGTA
jgi:hypothetical protein